MSAHAHHDHDLGYFVFAGLCLLVVLWTERGRLFRPQHAGPA